MPKLSVRVEGKRALSMKSLKLIQPVRFALLAALSFLGCTAAVSTGTPDAAANVRSAATGSVPTKSTGAGAIPRLLMMDAIILLVSGLLLLPCPGLVVRPRGIDRTRLSRFALKRLLNQFDYLHCSLLLGSSLILSTRSSTWAPLADRL